ncbi:hypothetical protein SUDANB15_01014 [Streptomyces sp. enrichment culture]
MEQGPRTGPRLVVPARWGGNHHRCPRYARPTRGHRPPHPEGARAQGGAGREDGGEGRGRTGGRRIEDPSAASGSATPSWAEHRNGSDRPVPRARRAHRRVPAAPAGGPGRGPGRRPRPPHRCRRPGPAPGRPWAGVASSSPPSPATAPGPPSAGSRSTPSPASRGSTPVLTPSGAGPTARATDRLGRVPGPSGSRGTRRARPAGSRSRPASTARASAAPRTPSPVTFAESSGAGGAPPSSGAPAGPVEDHGAGHRRGRGAVLRPGLFPIRQLMGGIRPEFHAYPGPVCRTRAPTA